LLIKDAPIGSASQTFRLWVGSRASPVRGQEMVRHDGPVSDDTEEGGRPHATLEEEVSHPLARLTPSERRPLQPMSDPRRAPIQH
jgi:hypothetical protein